MPRALVQNPKDNVATVLETVRTGDLVRFQAGDEISSVEAKNDIPFGHKIAIRDIAIGENVYKYGQVIGRCTEPIKQGFHAHVHNIESLRARGDLQGGLSCL